MKYIHESANLPQDYSVGEFSVIHENVTIGEGTVIGSHTVIHPGTILGKKCQIADHAVLGKKPQIAKTSTVKAVELKGLAIGDRTMIGAGTVIYAGTCIGEDCLIADQSFIRERCEINSFVIVGRGVCIENQVRVGCFTKIQSGSYITAYSILEDYVFIAPMVTTTNDNFMGRTEKRYAAVKGPTIKKGARVGGGSILLPGIIIGEEAFVAAGALVTKNLAPGQIYKGFPAVRYRVVPNEELLDNKKEGENHEDSSN